MKHLPAPQDPGSRTPGPSPSVADPAGPLPGGVLRLRRIGPESDLPSASAMLRLLDDVEQARVARTADARQAALFVAGRYLLRMLVADLLGTRAGSLVSCFECPACGPNGVPDHGRPAYLLHGERIPLALSLSRADGFVLLGALGTVGPSVPPRLDGAGSETRPGLGVDLTAVAAVDFEGFDAVALTPGERTMVDGLPSAARRAVRARLWARKEALVKASGTGFTDRGPDAIGVLQEPSVTDLTSIDGEALEPLGLVAAVAVDP